MARRLKFSVVGLPHYTIWHLYEPSVDDLRHMDEMEKEKKDKEKKEKEEKERLEKISSQFDNPSGQWDKDKASLNFLANKDKEKQDGSPGPKQAASKDGSPKEAKPKVEAKPVAADQK
jgi:mannan polymerase II complex ANP1 subunit